MRDELHGENLDDTDEPDSFEAEGIQAFTRLATAVQGLESRLDALQQGLSREVGGAAKAASSASQAAERTEAAATAAREAALAGARSWTAYAAIIILAGVLSAGIAGYLLGEQAGQATGQAAGYRAARDEQAAASWANTPSGQLAFALDRAGSLGAVARCSGQGWKPTVQDGRKVCYPQATPDGKVYGWTLP